MKINVNEIPDEMNDRNSDWIKKVGEDLRKKDPKIKANKLPKEEA